MREAMRQKNKKEVLIKTSTGEFRFEGISQKFTRKLYEWEESRGIAPEASTIALLDPNYQPEPQVSEYSLLSSYMFTFPIIPFIITWVGPVCLFTGLHCPC